MRKAPPSERMTSVEFQKWVKDMGYAERPKTTRSGPRFKIPYDPAEIGRDLGIHPRYVPKFWSGLDAGEEALVSFQVTRLCHALLALHQTRKALDKATEKHPELTELLESIRKKARMPVFKMTRRNAPKADDDGKDGVE